MDLIQGVLLDITGVLKEGEFAIAGSIEAVRRLRSLGIKIRFVTNETQVTKKALTAQLTNLGYDLTENEVLSPAPVMAQICKEKGLRPHLLVHPNVFDEFKEIDQSNPNCVVLGDAADHFSYNNMNSAFRTLINMEKPCLFSLGKGRYYQENGELVLDVGAFTAGLEYATGSKATIIGKPQADVFKTALQDMGVLAAHAVMVGDDLISDVGGAQDSNIRGILVRTGKYRPSDENHPQVKPYLIADNLAQAVEHITQNFSTK